MEADRGLGDGILQGAGGASAQPEQGPARALQARLPAREARLPTATHLRLAPLAAAGQTVSAISSMGLSDKSQFRSNIHVLGMVKPSGRVVDCCVLLLLLPLLQPAQGYVDLCGLLDRDRGAA